MKAGAIRFLRPIARMATHRLDVRIITLFLGLLLAVQLASFLAIRHSIEASAQVQIASELRTGENVLQRLLVQNEQKLTDGAHLLAADYGFRSAIASSDRATILDALDNQGERIGANAALFTDARHQLVVSTVPEGPRLRQLVRASLPSASPAGADTTVRILDDAPYQLVTVPVRAPHVIGHVSMGFPITAGLVQDMEELSPLRMALLERPSGGAWRVLPIGRHASAWHPLQTQLHGSARQPELALEGEALMGQIVPLAQDGSREVAALLLRSVDEAVAPYRRLQLALLVITLAALAVFGAGSFVTARRITNPIKQLSALAKRLGKGDYSTPVEVASRDEVHDLACSFEAMRQEMQQREAQIRRLAYWDGLTGLPNREHLRNLLGERLAHARSSGSPCALLMLDLDRFKPINDVLGHAFGNRVLRQIAMRLSEGLVRDGDCVARLSGDEFAVLLPDTDRDAACAIAHRLREALELPMHLDDQTVDVGAGFGVALFPEHGIEPDELLGHAEVAMYAAKEKQVPFQLYDPALDSASAESLSLLSDLRTAVDHDQLRLFLQPKVALPTGQVVGAEALVRWQHPLKGLMVPARFIQFAEQTGFIRVLTGWMVERCALRSRELRAKGLPLKFAVNLSTRDLLDQDLAAKFERLLRREAIDPRSLCMEITESAIMKEPHRALETLARLHSMGLRLSIDDFGTGYSSLAYLKRLPLHELKIDKSFVMAMESDRADLKIVRSTIDLAHNLGLSVVAEGVENAKTWALLRALGCDEAQGFFISRPMPEDQFAGWMSTWSAPRIMLGSEVAVLD